MNKFVCHLSLRVPWQDRTWDGCVCHAPLENSSCLALQYIANNRDDDFEKRNAGKAFDELPPDQIPPCLKHNSGFLNPHPHTFKNVMPYSINKWNSEHSHILPKEMCIPDWGALVLPYRWMLKNSGFDIAKERGLDADPSKEPANPEWLKRTSWIHNVSNQQILLDAFAQPLVEEESLVLFYATQTPLCEDLRRILVGAALLQKKHDLAEYPYKNDSSTQLRAMIWDRPIQHSLRRKNDADGYDDGFVMPYHKVLEKLENQLELDPTDYVAFVPNDMRAQFSYGSEQVTHGTAATALLAARGALERTKSLLQHGPWDDYIDWIDNRLSRLWKFQGPAPGLSEVLSALHPGFSGTMFAISLNNEIEENTDPWPIIDSIFSGDRSPPDGSPEITNTFRKRWENEKKNPQQLDFLKLLARMELTKDQAKRALKLDKKEILSNPYQLFEKDRAEKIPISFGTVDRGLHPGKEVKTTHPLPAACNSDLREYDNEHRLRAACVQILESSSVDGHTLLPVETIAEKAHDLSVVHEIPLDATLINIFRDSFKPVVSVIDDKERMMVQLDRYVTSATLLQSAIDNRLENAPQVIQVPWRERVNDAFGKLGDNEDEERARSEKVTALERLASSRIAVLVGAAGTGKTTVIKLLLDQKEIVKSHLLLLAPTGKARVRLGHKTGHEESAQTVAQFLLGLDRYDADTGRYFTKPGAKKATATTCVVDESSMLTEDMLAAIVDALPVECRLILIGDPFQLPPIGAGRPFIDIIEYLRGKKNGSGVGELETPRRQVGYKSGESENNISVLHRADVQLANIFSGRRLQPGEDQILESANQGLNDETVKYHQWRSPAELADLIDKVLAEELNTTEEKLVPAFEISLGAKENSRGYIEFGQGSSRRVDHWQILSVHRNGPGGSIFLNRGIKERLRRNRLDNTRTGNKKSIRFAPPLGSEQITYGDKVICTRNHKRSPWLYNDETKGEPNFIANGEIGIVTGQWSLGGKIPRFTHVEFNDRDDRNFSFNKLSDLNEDGQPPLELAYALTVHKAQGSEFGSVILVLPDGTKLVSREMLYTALTRQQKRIWILHQGPFNKFLEFRHYDRSAIAKRITNLLHTSSSQESKVPADSVEPNRNFLETHLIHKTVRGDMVRSKSELIIANILYNLEKDGHLTYEVEPQLTFKNSWGRWADFMVEAKGKAWYWEHCGMLHVEYYRDRWENKKKLYASNGFTIYSVTNTTGRLIETTDTPEHGFDAQAIEDLARKLFVDL